MVADLQEAINAEKLHNNIASAKLDYINKTNDMANHVDPNRELSPEE